MRRKGDAWNRADKAVGAPARSSVAGGGLGPLGVTAAAAAAALVAAVRAEDEFVRPTVAPSPVGSSSEPKVSFAPGSIFGQAVDVLRALAQVEASTGAKIAQPVEAKAGYRLSQETVDLLAAMEQSVNSSSLASNEASPSFAFTSSQFGPSLDLAVLSNPSTKPQPPAEEGSEWVEEFEAVLNDSLYVRADSTYQIAEVEPESDGLFVPPLIVGGGGGGGLALGGGGAGAAVSGAVIDGYVDGARVFLDIDGDYVWDQDSEPSAITEGGFYSFSTTVDPSLYNIVAVGGLDGGTSVDILVAPGANPYVTPISTLYASAEDASEGQGAVLLEQLGLSADDLTYDVYDVAAAGEDGAGQAATALRTGIALLSVAATVGNLYGNLVPDADTATGVQAAFSALSGVSASDLASLINGATDEARQGVLESVARNTMAAGFDVDATTAGTLFDSAIGKFSADVASSLGELKALDETSLSQMAEVGGAIQSGTVSYLNNEVVAEIQTQLETIGFDLKTISKADLIANSAAIAAKITTAASNVAAFDLAQARTEQKAILAAQAEASTGSVKVKFDAITVDAALGNSGAVSTFDIVANDKTVSGKGAVLVGVGVVDPFVVSGSSATLDGSTLSFQLSAARKEALDSLLPEGGGETVQQKVAAGGRSLSLMALDDAGQAHHYVADLTGFTLVPAADGSDNFTATATFSDGVGDLQAITDGSGEISFLIAKAAPDGYSLAVVDNQLEVTIQGQEFLDLPANSDVNLPGSFKLTYVVLDPEAPTEPTRGIVTATVKPPAPIVEVSDITGQEAGPSDAVVIDDGPTGKYNGHYSAFDIDVSVGIARDEGGDLVLNGLGLNGSLTISGLPTGSVLELGEDHVGAVTVKDKEVWVLQAGADNSLRTNILTGDFSGLKVLVPEHLSGDFDGIQVRAETRYLGKAASGVSDEVSLSIKAVTDGVTTSDAFGVADPWVAATDPEEDITYALFTDTSGLPIDASSVVLVDSDGSEGYAGKLRIVDGPGAELVTLKTAFKDTDVAVGYVDASQQAIVFLVSPEVGDPHAKILEILGSIDVTLAGHFSGDINFELTMGSLEATLFDEGNPLQSPIVFEDSGAVSFVRTVAPLADTPTLERVELIVADDAGGIWRQNDYADNPENPSQSSFFMVPVGYSVSTPDSNELRYVAIRADHLSAANASITLNKDLPIEDLTDAAGVAWRVVPLTAGEEFYLRVPYETFSPVAFDFAPITRDVNGAGTQTSPAFGEVTTLELPFESVPQAASVSVLSFSGSEDVPVPLSAFLSISPGQGRKLSDLVVEITATGDHAPTLYRGETLVAAVAGKLVADLSLTDGDVSGYTLKPSANSVASIDLDVEVLDPYRDGSSAEAPSSGVVSGQVKLAAVADGVDQAQLEGYSATVEMDLEVKQPLNGAGSIFEKISLLDDAENYNVRLVLPSGAPADSALVTVDGTFLMPTVVAASPRHSDVTVTYDSQDLSVYAVSASNRFGLEAGDYAFIGSRDNEGGYQAVKVVDGSVVEGSQTVVNPYAAEAFLGLERVAYSFTKAQVENSAIEITPRAGLAGLTDVSVQVFTSQGTVIQAIPNEVVLPILVRADAIAPEGQAADAVADEDQVGGIALSIDLPINPNRVDFEKLGLFIVVESGEVDEQATFTALPYQATEGDEPLEFSYSSTLGGWRVFGMSGDTAIQFDPADLTYHPSANFSGVIDFSVTPFARTADGSEESADPLTMSVQVDALAEGFTLTAPAAAQVDEDGSGTIDLVGLVAATETGNFSDSDEIMVFEWTAPVALGFRSDGEYLTPVSLSANGEDYSYTLTHRLSTLGQLAPLEVVPRENYSTDETGVEISVTARTLEPTNGDQFAVDAPITATVVVKPVPDAPDAPLLLSRSVYLDEAQGVDELTENGPGQVEYELTGDNSVALSSVFNLPTLTTGNADEQVSVVVKANSGFGLFSQVGQTITKLPDDGGLYRIAADDYATIVVRGAQYASTTTGIALEVNTETSLTYEVGVWDEVQSVLASEQWVKATLYLAPVASGLSGSLQASASHDFSEDATSKLYLSSLYTEPPTAVDSSETVAFYVTVPDFVTVAAKGGSGYALPVPIPTDDGSRYLISEANLANVSLSLPRNVAADFDVVFEAVSKESNGSVSDSLSPVTVSVQVAPVADKPILSVPAEASGLINDSQTYIKIPVRAYLADTDGSETLQVEVRITATGGLTAGDVTLGTYGASDPTVFSDLAATLNGGVLSYTATTPTQLAALSRLAIQSANDYRGDSALSVEVVATSTDSGDRSTSDSAVSSQTFDAAVYQEIDPVTVEFGAAADANFVASIPIQLTAPGTLPQGVTPDNLSLLLDLSKSAQENDEGAISSNLYFATVVDGVKVPVGATIGEGSGIWLISGRDLFVPGGDGTVTWSSARKDLVLITDGNKNDVELTVTSFISDPEGGSFAKFPADGGSAVTHTAVFDDTVTMESDPLVLSFDGSAITSVKNDNDSLVVDLSGDGVPDEIPTYWFDAEATNYAFFVREDSLENGEAISITDLFVDFAALVNEVGVAAAEDGVLTSVELADGGINLWSDLNADGVYNADDEPLGLSADGTTAIGAFSIFLPPEPARASAAGAIQSLFEAEVVFYNAQQEALAEVGTAFAVAIPYLEASLSEGSVTAGSDDAFDSGPSVAVNPVGSGPDGNRVPEDVASKPGFVVTLTEAQKASDSGILQDPNHLLKVVIDTGDDAINSLISLSAGAKKTDASGDYFVLTGSEANKTIKVLDLPEHWVGEISVTVTPYASGLNGGGTDAVLKTIAGTSVTGTIDVVGVPDTPDVVMREVAADGDAMVRPPEGSDVYLTTDWNVKSVDNDLLLELTSPGMTEAALGYSQTDQESLFFEIQVHSLSDLVLGTDFYVYLDEQDLGTLGEYTIAAGDLADFHLELNDGVAGAFEFFVQGFSEQGALRAYNPAIGYYIADVQPVADGIAEGSLSPAITQVNLKESAEAFTLATVGLDLIDSSEVFEIDILVGGSARAARDLLSVNGWSEVVADQAVLDEFVAGSALIQGDATPANWRMFTYRSETPGSDVAPDVVAEFDQFFNGEITLLARAKSIELVEGKSSEYQYSVASAVTVAPDVSTSGFERTMLVDVSNDSDPDTFHSGSRIVVEEVLSETADQIVSRFKINATAFDPDETVVIRPVSGQLAEQYFDVSKDTEGDFYTVSLKEGVVGLPPSAARKLTFEYEISEGEGEDKDESGVKTSSLTLSIDLIKDVSPAVISADSRGVADSTLSIVDGKTSDSFLMPLVTVPVGSDDDVYYLLSGVPDWLVPYAGTEAESGAIGLVVDSVAGETLDPAQGDTAVALQTFKISPEEIPGGELYFEVANRSIVDGEPDIPLTWKAVFVEPTNMRTSISEGHELLVSVAPSPQKPAIYGSGAVAIEEDRVDAEGAPDPYSLEFLSFSAGSFPIDTIRAALYISSDAVTLAGVSGAPEKVVVLYRYDATTETVLRGGANRAEIDAVEWGALGLAETDTIPIVGSADSRPIFDLADGVLDGVEAGLYAAFHWDKYDFSDAVSNPGGVSWAPVESNYNGAISYELSAWQELGSAGKPDDVSLIAYRRFSLDYTNVPEDVTLTGIPDITALAEGELVELSGISLTGMDAGDEVAIELALPESFVAYRRLAEDDTFEALANGETLEAYQFIPAYVENGVAYYSLSQAELEAQTDSALIAFVAPSGTGGEEHQIVIKAQANDPTTGALGKADQHVISFDVIATLDTPELVVQKAAVASETVGNYSTVHATEGVILTKPLELSQGTEKELASRSFSYISYSPDEAEIVRTTITLNGADAEKFELSFGSGVTWEPGTVAGEYVVTSASRLPISVTVQQKQDFWSFQNFVGSNVLDILGDVSGASVLYRVLEEGSQLIVSQTENPDALDALTTWVGDDANQVGVVVNGADSSADHLKVFDIDPAALGLSEAGESALYAVTGSEIDGWSLVPVEEAGVVKAVDDLPYISIISESLYEDTLIVASNQGEAFSSEYHVPIVVKDVNDQPIIQPNPDLTAKFEEAVDDSGLSDQPSYTDGGTLTFSDADEEYVTSAGNFVHKVDIIASGEFEPRGTIRRVDPDQTFDGSRVVDWEYQLFERAIDDMYYGDVETEQYEIIIDDGLAGGVNSTTIVVTISGDNDLPVIDLSQVSISDGAAGNAETEISVAFSDVDLNQSNTTYFSANVEPTVAFVEYQYDVVNQARILNIAPDLNFLTPTAVLKDVGSSTGEIKFTAMALNQVVDFWIEGNSLTLEYDVTLWEQHATPERLTSATETIKFVVDEFVLPDIGLLTGHDASSLAYRQVLFGYDAADGLSNDFSVFAVDDSDVTVLGQDYIWAISTSTLIDGAPAIALNPEDIDSLGVAEAELDGDQIYFLNSGDLGGRVATSGSYVKHTFDFSGETYLVWADREIDDAGLVTYDVRLPMPVMESDRSTNILGTAGQDVILLSTDSVGGLVYGGAGHDLIEGSDGDDMIIASAGVDEMRGGGGSDAFVVSGEIVFDNLADLSTSDQDILFEELIGQSSSELTTAMTSLGLGSVGFAGFVTDFDASIDSIVFQGVDPSSDASVFEVNEQVAVAFVSALDDSAHDTLAILLINDHSLGWDDTLLSSLYVYA